MLIRPGAMLVARHQGGTGGRYAQRPAGPRALDSTSQGRHRREPGPASVIGIDYAHHPPQVCAINRYAIAPGRRHRTARRHGHSRTRTPRPRGCAGCWPARAIALLATRMAPTSRSRSRSAARRLVSITHEPTNTSSPAPTRPRQIASGTRSPALTERHSDLGVGALHERLAGVLLAPRHDRLRELHGRGCPPADRRRAGGELGVLGRRALLEIEGLHVRREPDGCVAARARTSVVVGARDGDGGPEPPDSSDHRLVRRAACGRCVRARTVPQAARIASARPSRGTPRRAESLAPRSSARDTDAQSAHIRDASG